MNDYINITYRYFTFSVPTFNFLVNFTVLKKDLL